MKWSEISLSETVRGYHGSSSGVTDPTFVMGHTGQNSHTFGHYSSQRWGAFFSDNPDFSRMYGEPVAYDLNLHHTLDLENDNNTIWNFVQSFDPHDPEQRNLWQDARAIMRSNHYWQLFEDDVGGRFSAYLKELGYDSASFVEYLEDDHGTEHRSHSIVVLDPSLIKRASDNPRPSPDNPKGAGLTESITTSLYHGTSIDNLIGMIISNEIFR